MSTAVSWQGEINVGPLIRMTRGLPATLAGLWQSILTCEESFFISSGRAP